VALGSAKDAPPGEGAVADVARKTYDKTSDAMTDMNRY